MVLADAFWNLLSDIADIASIIGFSLAVGGLVLVLLQLDRTQSAVEAATEAAHRAERDSALRHILSLLPSMEQISESLDSAVSAGEFPVARRELASWRNRGSEVLGMLARRTDLGEELKPNLTKAIAQAGAAKARLIDESVNIKEATENARADISRSVAELSELAGQLKAYPSEEEET